ncbi:MAG: hypothetical protein ACREA2_21885 [Blastocatellia bacterium]
MAEEKILTHAESEKIVRQFRAEIEALQRELCECPDRYERAMQDQATAEDLETLEREEAAIEKQSHNLVITHVNEARRLSQELGPVAQQRDREAYDTMIAAETRLRENDIQRARERDADEHAWREAQDALARIRLENQATFAPLTGFVLEFTDRTRKRAQERREKRAAELSAVTG